MLSVPPRIAAKPIGISRREAGMCVRFAIRSMAGRNSAAAPTFCMNAEMPPTTPDTVPIRRFSLLPPTRMIGLMTRFMSPERSTP